MGIILATLGAILVIISVAGGTPIESKLITIQQPVPVGDRCFAGVLGMTFIVIVVLLRYPELELILIIALAVCVISIIVYACFLYWTGREQKNKD